MLKKSFFFILILCFSTSIYAYEDSDARRAILQLRTQIKEIETRLNSEDSKIASLVKDLNTRLDVIESDNKKLSDENERIRAALNNRLVAKENPEYQELRDEINSINRLLLQIIGK